MAKKRGRKPFEDRRLVRSRAVTVRLTEGGYAKVQKMAEAKGLSLDAYVRTVLQKLFDGSLIYR